MKQYDYKEFYDKKYEQEFWTVNRAKKVWFSNYVRLKIFKRWSENLTQKDFFLDVGGGFGNWASRFLDEFKKVAVLDVSPKALEQIPEKEIIKIQGSALDIPVKSNSVDLVLLSDIFEHIFIEDLPKMMKELYRILSDDGRIIIYAPQYGWSYLDIFFRLKGESREEFLKKDYESGHVNKLSFKEYKQLINSSNLEIDDYYHYSIIFQGLTDSIKDFIAKLIDMLRGKQALRKGQAIKEELKSKESPLFCFVFRLLSYISFLDVFIFGKIYPGSSIFLCIKKGATNVK